MNCYRVTFYSIYVLPNGSTDTRTMWVDANNEHHAVAEATMLAMVGTGNEDADLIGGWLRIGAIQSVYSVIETS
jgi:hypothetical protein